MLALLRGSSVPSLPNTGSMQHQLSKSLRNHEAIL